MERDAESVDLASYAAHHADFHAELLLSSGNARLAKFVPLVRLSSQLHVSRHLAAQGASPELIGTLQRDANTEHRNIWRRIVARDLAGADQAVKEHLERSIERFRAR
jgi:DNA-binding GntR family transcriptional regulator